MKFLKSDSLYLTLDKLNLLAGLKNDLNQVLVQVVASWMTSNRGLKPVHLAVVRLDPDLYSEHITAWQFKILYVGKLFISFLSCFLYSAYSP